MRRGRVIIINQTVDIPVVVTHASLVREGQGRHFIHEKEAPTQHLVL